MVDNIFSRRRLQNRKLLRRAQLLALALLVANLCFAPLSAFVRAQEMDSARNDSSERPNEKSEARRTVKNKISMEAETEDAAAALENEASQPAYNNQALLSATRPRLVSSRLMASEPVEKPKAEPEKPAANILNLSPPQLSSEQGRPGSLNVYLMTEYRRDEIKYTGKPSLTFQFPNPVPPFSVPDAPIFFVPSAFEPNDEIFTGYGSATVKDFGFEKLRFDAQVSFRFTADLDGTTVASPFIGTRDAFRQRRIYEPLTFYTDVRGFLSDDGATRFTARIGRQNIYGAGSFLRMDGGTFTINNPRYTLDVYGGRRVSFYSDPRERGIIGENFLFRPTERTTLRYDFLHYIDNSHNLEVRHGIGESWIFDSSLFLIDEHPVDLNFGAHYLPSAGKTRVNFNFLQKLSSHDFFYDQAFRSFARNPENQIRFLFFPIPPTGEVFNGNGRLNLFQINPYTQFYVDGYRYLTQKLGVGGTVWMRKVNDTDEEGPFDNSFQEYHVNADYFPSSAFEIGTEYRYRHLSREDPERAQFFFDIGREGEKTFHEVYANAAYHMLNTRLTLEGGLFYRRFDTQSRLINLEGADTTGYTAGVRWRIARNYKLLLEYGFDKELAFLNPDIDYTQQFRIRFEWRFNR